jgi:hypothetical protein
MLKKLLKGLLSGSIYARIYANRIRVRNLENGIEVDLRSEAPFTTKRLLVGEFSKAERLLKNGLRKVHKGTFSPSPIILIQPMEMVEGGLSEVEERLFKELAAGAGARRVLIWIGHELSDHEALLRCDQIR